MFSVNARRYYLYHKPTDMRKSFDGLCGIVSSQLGFNPMNGDVFIFINRQRNRIGEVLPKSAIGEAVSYTLNLWPRLTRYVEDGRFRIDNNLIENSIRPVALGRKNYLFAGSHACIY